jgi:tetratricopeptide (TPR) repeat protein
MSTSSKIWIILAAALIVGFAAITSLSRFLDQQYQRLPETDDKDQLVMQGSRLRGFVFGNEGLVADWYWMRSLQYIGDKVLASKNDTINIDDLRPLDPRLLYPYLDIATDLDPQYLTAYSYGAVVLPAIDPEKAISLTEKGIEHNPAEWRLYQYLGYINWRLGRFEKAAEVYEKGSQIPGSPNFLKMMAVSMKTEGGSRDTARTIFTQMFNEADDDQTRIFAYRKLAHLDSLEERDAIRPILKSHLERTGKCPDAWKEIFPELRKVKLPNGKDFRIDEAQNIVDPSGAPYVIDPSQCDVILDKTKTRIQLQ